MKKYLLVILLSICAVSSAGGERDAIIVQAVKDFYAGNVEAFHAVCEDEVKEYWASGKMERFLRDIERDYGKLLIVHRPGSMSYPPVNPFGAWCDFERGILMCIVEMTKENRIGLFRFVIIEVKDYLKDTESFCEERIIFGKDRKLLGSLTLPKEKEPFPVVILVHGPGPNYLEEAIGADRIFRSMAYGLGARGIGVLRYSNRTFIYDEMTPTVKEEVIDDVVSAVEFLKDRGFRRVYILGHSLGGMLIPRISERLGKEAAGYIGMAVPTGSLEDLLLRRKEFMLEMTFDWRKDMVTAITKDAAREVKALNENSDPEKVIMNHPVSYWLDLKNYKPVEAALSVNQPVLFLQGKKDNIVRMVEFEIYKDKLSSKSNFRFKAYPKLNHLFMDGKGHKYDRGNISDEVLDDIRIFVKGY